MSASSATHPIVDHRIHLSVGRFMTSFQLPTQQRAHIGFGWAPPRTQITTRWPAASCSVHELIRQDRRSGAWEFNTPRGFSHPPVSTGLSCIASCPGRSRRRCRSDRDQADSQATRTSSHQAARSPVDAQRRGVQPGGRRPPCPLEPGWPAPGARGEAHWHGCQKRCAQSWWTGRGDQRAAVGICRGKG